MPCAGMRLCDSPVLFYPGFMWALVEKSGFEPLACLTSQLRFPLRHFPMQRGHTSPQAASEWLLVFAVARFVVIEVHMKPSFRFINLNLGYMITLKFAQRSAAMLLRACLAPYTRQTPAQWHGRNCLRPAIGELRRWPTHTN